MKTPLQDMLDGHSSEGELESQGTFRIDSVKASEKLEAFQLSHQGDYLVKFLQVACELLGGPFFLRIGVFHTTAAFSASTAHLSKLDSLPGALLEGKAEPNSLLDHFATGLRGCLATTKRADCFIDGKPFLRVKEGKTEWLGLPELSKPTSEVSLRFSRRSLLRGLKQSYLRADDHLALLDRGRFYPSPILVDNRRIFQGWNRKLKHSRLSVANALGPFYLLEAYLEADSQLENIIVPDNNRQDFTFREKGIYKWAISQRTTRAEWKSPTLFRITHDPPNRSRRFRCGIALTVNSELEKMGCISFLIDGAHTDSKRIDLGIPGIHVIVSGSGLTTDLGQFQIVEDGLYKQRVRALKARLAPVSAFLKDMTGEIRDFLKETKYQGYDPGMSRILGPEHKRALDKEANRISETLSLL